MANMFGQMKQAMQMRKEAKRIQSEIERITSEYSNGGITVTVRGDFTVTALKVAPEALTEAMAGKPERFETMMLNVLNGAIKAVKKQTEEQMAKAMKGSNLASMFGG